jgi:hypothetical protein
VVASDTEQVRAPWATLGKPRWKKAQSERSSSSVNCAAARARAARLPGFGPITTEPAPQSPGPCMNVRAPQRSVNYAKRKQRLERQDRE